MKSNEIPRDKPDDKGRNEGRVTRDNENQQPGTSNISSGNRDEPKEKRTDSRKGAFNEEHPDLRKDKIFDEGEE